MWIKNKLIFSGLALCLALHQPKAQSLTNVHFNNVSKFKIWSPKEKKHLQFKQEEMATVIILLSPECPMCINYTSLMKSIHNKYGLKLNIAGLVPGMAYNDHAINEFSNTYKLNFPVYMDSTMKLTKYLKGEVTPQAFLFDSKGSLVYNGALDNWLSSLGKKRTIVDEHYLLNAIEQLLSGTKVSLSYIKPQGCLLNEY